MPVPPSQGALGSPFSHTLAPRIREEGGNGKQLQSPGLLLPYSGQTGGLCCPGEKSITFITFFHLKPVNL